MISNSHEQGIKERSYISVRRLRRALNSGIRKFAAVLAVVNSVFLLLTAAVDFERLPDAMLLPVCSVLLIAALFFLRNAALQYAGELSANSQVSSDDREKSAGNVGEIPDKNKLSA